MAHDFRETEWQFDAVDLRPVIRWLEAPAAGSTRCLRVVPAGSASQVDRYLDTDDQRLHRAGYALRLRGRVDDPSRGDPQEPRLGHDDPGPRRRREISEPLDAGRSFEGHRRSRPVGMRVRPSRGTGLRLLFEVRTRRRLYALESDAFPRERSPSTRRDPPRGRRRTRADSPRRDPGAGSLPWMSCASSSVRCRRPACCSRQRSARTRSDVSRCPRGSTPLPVRPDRRRRRRVDPSRRSLGAPTAFRRDAGQGARNAPRRRHRGASRHARGHAEAASGALTVRGRAPGDRDEAGLGDGMARQNARRRPRSRRPTGGARPVVDGGSEIGPRGARRPPRAAREPARGRAHGDAGGARLAPVRDVRGAIRPHAERSSRKPLGKRSAARTRDRPRPDREQLPQLPQGRRPDPSGITGRRLPPAADPRQARPIHPHSSATCIPDRRSPSSRRSPPSRTSSGSTTTRMSQSGGSVVSPPRKMHWDRDDLCDGRDRRTLPAEHDRPASPVPEGVPPVSGRRWKALRKAMEAKRPPSVVGPPPSPPPMRCPRRSAPDGVGRTAATGWVGMGR